MYGHIDDQAQTITGLKSFASGVVVDSSQTYLPANGVYFSPNLIFYASALNTLTFQRSGNDYFDFSSLSISSNGKASLMTATPSATVPVIRPWLADNTGIGGAIGTNEVSIISNSIEVIKVTTTEAQFPVGLVVDTGLTYLAANGVMLGDGDSGVYESADDVLKIQIAAVDTWTITAALLGAVATTGGGIYYTGASGTVPTILPRVSDVASGIGSRASSEISLIANNTETVRIIAGRFIISPGAVAGTTGLFFGDNDTGFSESADDNLNFITASVTRFNLTSSGLSSIITGGALVSPVAATGTIPVYTFENDTDTGIGRVAANQLSIISNGNEVIRVNAAEAQFPVGLTVDTNATYLIGNGLCFGDGDSCLYEAVDDEITVNLANVDKFVFQSNSFQSLSTFSCRLQKSAGSATDPVFSFVDDVDTGIGRADANKLSLVTGGTEAARFEAAKITILNGNIDITYNSTTNVLTFNDATNFVSATLTLT